MIQQFRVGHGYDLHRLQSGGRLMLGGICVAEDFSALAHSDGDVVIHAAVDALLGALGRGDIGEWFANTDPQWKNAPSRLFLDRVLRQLPVDGWQIGNMDVTILAERPRINPFKQDMALTLSRLLSIQPSQLNIKAGTNEGCDAIGRGEAIAADVVVLLERVPATP